MVWVGERKARLLSTDQPQGVAVLSFYRQGKVDASWLG